MKKVLSTAIALLTVFSVNAVAQSQEQKPPTAEESAASEVERLERILKLEDWQVFYVDSTLTHDFVEMEAELKGMQEAKVGNVDLYFEVQDRWWERIETTLKKYFTEDQWKKYLKSGMTRGQKDSWKRREKKRKNENKNK